jgi:hypothetical protein
VVGHLQRADCARSSFFLTYAQSVPGLRRADFERAMHGLSSLALDLRRPAWGRGLAVDAAIQRRARSKKDAANDAASCFGKPDLRLLTLRERASIVSH